MKQRKLVSSILVGLCTTFAMAALHAQDSSTTPQDQATTDQGKKKDEQQFETVTVTGSLIPRAQIETASPVITITAKDIQREGFKNVYDALHSLPVATGQIQDGQSTNSFTPGANTVSLLGLDPSFTLVLMNGRPLADYPFLYNGNSNFVDLNTIPTFLVDHIDILTGNQSAIYGSAAIAGVINIVLKQKVDGVTLDYRVGGYSDGGGAQQRLQIAGGKSWGKLDAIFGMELINQTPVFGYQRSFTDSRADNPTLNGAAATPELDRVALDLISGEVLFQDPGKSTCDAISNLFGGTLQYGNRPGHGSYCGSTTAVGYTTLLNGDKSANGYGSLKYQLNDSTQIYGDLLYDVHKVTYQTGGSYFWSNGSTIYDLDTADFVQLQHVFAPEEIGHVADVTNLERSYVVNAGIRGSLGDSSWNYDAYFHRSGYEADSKGRRLITAKADAFFLGKQDGVDPYGYGYPAYHSFSTKFWGAITPQDYINLSGEDRSDATTYTQVANLTVTNTELFTLPAGPVGFAGILEAGDQYWNVPVDPLSAAGAYFATGNTGGQGTRDRQAAAVELNVPIFSMLTADASARYDNYSIPTGSQSKLTYKIGLEFRPIETLLFRGNYSTAFRAPDMGYIFGGDHRSFTEVSDYYNCRSAKGDNFNCTPSYDVQIPNITPANHDLKYITAKSFGYGAVWSPTGNFNIKVDYYHIALQNEVAEYSPSVILSREADCRLGHTVIGTPVDINSQICQQTLAEVHRQTGPIGTGTLLSVTTFPLNLANELVSGITASTQYRFEAGRFGDFLIGADYNTTLKHEVQQFPTDPVDDLLRDGNYYGPYKEIGSAYLTWNIGAWSTTLHGQRYGKTFSHDSTTTVAPWMLYNASVQYNFNDDAAITLIANNVFNSRPPIDTSYGTYPYYNVFNYNPYGRLVMVEMNVHFGGGKK